MKKPDIDLSFGLKGRFKLDVYKADKDGNPTQLKTTTDWFNNLITDVGIENIGSNSGFGHIQACVVGSGNTPPTFSDTSLASFVALTNTLQTNWGGVAQIATKPYYITYSATYQFAAGVAAGNLTEVGFTSNPASATSSQSPLWCRALILDTGGNPTTITVLSDEILYVTYQLIVYLPNGGDDITGTFSQTISGTPTVFNYTIRPWGLNSIGTTTSSWSVDKIRGTVPPSLSAANSCTSNGDFVAINTTSRSGSTLFFSTNSDLPYTPGSKYIESTLSYSLTQGNQTWNMYWLMWPGHCSFQMKIDPPVTKNNTQVYSFNARTSWARHT